METILTLGGILILVVCGFVLGMFAESADERERRRKREEEQQRLLLAALETNVCLNTNAHDARRALIVASFQIDEGERNGAEDGPR